MKIKSHTGNMVDVRLKMYCRIDGHPENECGPIVSIEQDEYYDWSGVYIQGKSSQIYADIRSVTMLHCPFVVGDEFEFFDGNQWRRGDWGQKEAIARTIKKFPFTFRHVNPDLRDSPDYKPTENQL